MLSYQHSFHAGNLADVHKHALLSDVLSYLVRKDKPISYIETHSGRALYDLKGAQARKIGEAAYGIQSLEKVFHSDHPYLRCLSRTRENNGLDYYPGSPMIAALSLRNMDKLHLAELHPQEYQALAINMRSSRARIYPGDGWQIALGIAPPTPRRGMIFIDPSYEVKTDYETIPARLTVLHRIWNIGILVLWYPILEEGTHTQMLDELTERFPNAFRHEVSFPLMRVNYHMVGSGMFVVNPTFGIEHGAAAISRVFSF
jgi:23S rRNA (adenine2030-N6)-methyltransferase